ncbi:hypothetical protein FHA58_16190 [Escherichia coli]|uniref:hypothetical protein n=1 Tax=Escherichia coli TaxID=562 RepID=UPI001C7014AC|nr:hypothetical protein [Escherichia coli]MBW9552060.1 hypothetical protein [Escherichia coli]MBW9570034.1 hypothetical protein [Escherichia coli]
MRDLILQLSKSSIYSTKPMHAEGRPVDILAVTGNMDEEHRTWFCARYAWYCQQMMQARELELEH